MDISLGQLIQTTANIAGGQQASGGFKTNGLSLCGILMPAAFTGTALTFLASVDGVDFFPIYNAAGVVSYSAQAGQYIAIDPQDFYGVTYLQIKSGSAEAATRALICSLKGL